MPDLFMHALRISTPAIFGLGRKRGLPMRDVDLGYMTHVYLGEAFGEGAPSPFAVVEDRGRELIILGYSDHDDRALSGFWEREGVQRYLAKPTVKTKAMPSHWPIGKRYAFQVQVCPVARLSSDGTHHRRGAEVDVFLREAWRRPDDKLDRETIYREWLRARLEGGGAEINPGDAHMTCFSRERFVRRTHGTERKSRLVERPVATFVGALNVNDSEAFSRMIRRGVGRHRAFGFGMLLLRATPC